MRGLHDNFQTEKHMQTHRQAISIKPNNCPLTALFISRLFLRTVPTPSRHAFCFVSSGLLTPFHLFPAPSMEENLFLFRLRNLLLILLSRSAGVLSSLPTSNSKVFKSEKTYLQVSRRRNHHYKSITQLPNPLSQALLHGPYPGGTLEGMCDKISMIP